jgi:hypothetical protein
MNGIGLCKWCGNTARKYSGGYQDYCSERCSFQHSESIRIKREREEREEKLERENYLKSRQREDDQNKTYISINEYENESKKGIELRSNFKKTIIIRRDSDDFLNIDEDQTPPNKNKGVDSYIDGIFKAFKGFFS